MRTTNTTSLSSRTSRHESKPRGPYGRRMRNCQQLSREVIRVRDSERQHLARELHDEIGQTLVALRFNLQLLSNSGTSDAQEVARFENSIEIVDRFLAEVRDLSLSLRPSLLSETGLGPALPSYIKEQGSRSGTSINFVSVQCLF